MGTGDRTTAAGDQAVVVGASMAGLCAARVLADRFTRVVVLDRDVLTGPTPRKLVPQGRHPHLLLTAGARLLDEWFPGLTADLYAAGAVELDLCSDFLWHQAGGTQRRPSSGLVGPSMSRPLLESTIRARVSALPNVVIQGGVTVAGLMLDDEARRVIAVLIDEREEVAADLVVDATGRSARSVDWLAAYGYPAPATTVVAVDTRYVTRVFQRRSDFSARDWKAAAVIGDPDTKRLAMLLPMENDRWILSIAGLNGETPPTDHDEAVAYARQFDSPIIAELIAHGHALGEPVTHRFPANQRRHVERLRLYPLGWVLLGDAICSFDPIYGQGMTSAAQQAAALGRALDRHGPANPAFTKQYFRAAARIVNTPWSIAVGGDFAYPDTKGKKPFGTDILNRYMDRVIQAGQVDDDVVIRFNEVVALTRSPQSLLAPSFMLRVVARARRADRARRDQHSAASGEPATLEVPAD